MLLALAIVRAVADALKPAQALPVGLNSMHRDVYGKDASRGQAGDATYGGAMFLFHLILPFRAAEPRAP